MKNAIRVIADYLGMEIRRTRRRGGERESVSLKVQGSAKGTVLLSYVIQPFLLKDGEAISCSHTHDWESFEMARIFTEFGYDVDVIDYDDREFIPQREYSFFVSARTNFQRISQELNIECVKIVHLDTAHWLFNNTVAYQRCLALQQRRGVSVESIKWVEPNWAIEHADFATILGNEFTIGTYAYANKPLHRIPVSTCSVYPPPAKKDFESVRRSFMWFGSGGLVHKGLDLVLEVFCQMPDYHLYVCGPVEQERGFEEAYHGELYRTPNIHTVGWVDVTEQEFVDITNQCIGLIYPSCSEGQSGAVVACLHAGLIPVLSYESGVDVGDFGIILNDCSMEEIKRSIQRISGLAAEDLKCMAQRTWEFARVHHTREKFSIEYQHFVKSILSGSWAP
jgi:glycosyltransferase involved in cell wall biosynthesis